MLIIAPAGPCPVKLDVKLSDDMSLAETMQTQEVVEKWTKLKNEIFNQDIHYDVYTTTKEGEAKGLDFLLEKAKS